MIEKREPRRLRLGVVDDDAFTLAALKMLVRNGATQNMALIWAVRNGDTAIDLCVNAATRPDIVLIDMNMDKVDGATLCRRIRRISNRMILLTMTAHSLNLYHDLALRSGADMLLDKADPAQIRQTLIDYASGMKARKPTQLPAVAANDYMRTHDTAPLTDREIEIMDLTVEEYTAKEVANRIGISESTVKTHIRHVIAKLNVSNKLQAICEWNRRSRHVGAPR